MYKKEQIRVAALMYPEKFGIKKNRGYIDIIKNRDEKVFFLRAYNISIRGNSFDWRPTPYGRGSADITDSTWSVMSEKQIVEKIQQIMKKSPLHEAIVKYIGSDAGVIQANWVELPEKIEKKLFPKKATTNTKDCYFYRKVGNANLEINILPER